MGLVGGHLEVGVAIVVVAVRLVVGEDAQVAAVVHDGCGEFGAEHLDGGLGLAAVGQLYVGIHHLGESVGTAAELGLLLLAHIELQVGVEGFIAVAAEGDALYLVAHVQAILLEHAGRIDHLGLASLVPCIYRRAVVLFLADLADGELLCGGRLGTDGHGHGGRRHGVGAVGGLEADDGLVGAHLVGRKREREGAGDTSLQLPGLGLGHHLIVEEQLCHIAAGLFSHRERVGQRGRGREGLVGLSLFGNGDLAEQPVVGHRGHVGATQVVDACVGVFHHDVLVASGYVADAGGGQCVVVAFVVGQLVAAQVVSADGLGQGQVVTGVAIVDVYHRLVLTVFSGHVDEQLVAVGKRQAG